MVTQNRQYLMDGLPIFSLNMYKCTYNPGVASTHCVQIMLNIGLVHLQQSFKVNSRSVVVVESTDGGFSSHDVLKSRSIFLTIISQVVGNLGHS